MFSFSAIKEESDVYLSNSTANTNQKSERVQGVFYLLGYFYFMLLVYIPLNIHTNAIKERDIILFLFYVLN